MKLAIAGATGNIGSLTAAALERDGHEVVRMSRSLGVDLLSGNGLDEALTGVYAVIDVVNGQADGMDATVEFFGTMTRNLLAAEERAGVGHHVLLSIAGADRVEHVPHYAGKLEQERQVTSQSVPWTIVPATQFHDFAEMVAGWNETDGVAKLAPLLMRPIAPADVAEILAELAVGKPQGRYLDIAGPDQHDMVDMVRRSHQARGRTVKLVPTWSGLFGLEMSGNAMLPGENARIAPTTFEEWLAQQG